jgi:hypothetical protein
MHPQQEIVEKWIERLADSHPQQSAALRAPQPDPFRNPLGYAVRKGLSQLWEELLGEMKPEVIDQALDTILRIRAVQELSPSEAVGFVDQLRRLLCEAPTPMDRALLEARINQLTLAASHKYMQCREQIAAVRLHETERLTRIHRTASGKARA